MTAKKKMTNLKGKAVSSRKAGAVKGGFFGSLLKKIKKTAQ